MRTGLIATLIILASTAAGATPLSPEEKSVLIKGTNESCLENQVKQAANKAMTVGQLWTYCDCYAQAFAGILSAEDLERNKDGLTPDVQKKAGELSQQCAVSTLKKK